MSTQLKHPTRRNNNDAICYYRVSTKKQHDKGNSIPSQKEYAEAYAVKNNLTIIKEFVETKSASKIQIENFDYSRELYESLDGRPMLKEIMKLANMRRFKHLIVFSRDRLARNFELFVALRFFFNKCGVQIHYAKPGENILSETEELGKFFELILSSVAELESNLISARVKSGLKQSVRNKNWVSYLPPYGYITKPKGSKGKTIEPSLLEMENVKKVFKLYNYYGYSYRKIAEKMSELDPYGFWSEDKVERIIKNEIYKGYIIWNRRSKTDDNDIVRSPFIEGASIITDREWKESISLRYEKSKQKDPKYYCTHFLLRDKLICGYCNKPMKAKNYGKDKNGKERPCIYKCETKDNKRSHFIVKQNYVEQMFITEFCKVSITKISDMIFKRYCEEINKKHQETVTHLKKLSTEIKKIDDTLNKLTNLISNETDEDLLEIFVDEKQDLKRQLNELQKFKTDLEAKEKALMEELTRLSNKDSKNSLINKINDFINRFISDDFHKLEITQKRLVIDMLIDRVIIKRDEYSSNTIKSMEIVFKTPVNPL